MKRVVLMAFVLVVAVLLVGSFIPDRAHAQKKPIVLRLVIATPEGDFVQTFRDKEMAKRFNERAKGEYVIEVYPGMALAKLPEFFDAVRIGAVEMQFSNWGTFSNLDPRLGLLEMPFLFNTNKACAEGSKALLPLFDPILQEKFNAKGLGMMGTGGLGMWAPKPIKALEDLKGSLVACVSPPMSLLIKALGGSPVTIMFPDIYESLQKKIVDSSVQSAHGGVVFQYPDSCKHFTAFFGIPAVAGYTINYTVWKKMPPHIQKILTEETNKAAEWMADMLENKLPDLDLKVFKDKGVNIYYLPQAERDKWAKQLAPYNEKQFNSFGELGAKVKKISEEINKKFPYKADKSIM